MSMQHRIDGINALSDAEIVQLLLDICATRDARATVYVYDKMRARSIELTDGVKDALRRVEADRGRTPFTLRVPLNLAPHLEPSRRVHKICKGWRVSTRNTDAAAHLERAEAWVSAQPEGSVDARSSAGLGCTSPSV
eukprot:TRINITY_DN3055_c0_g3_i1.p2 TRINITY_DN3055_c0_g3~~TRINITY_DN3055_c0_g3_i1.p2  ORF type:complete len:137 (+),score=9.23 TRINITY_DN3055_c0_g3_i1:620-1030(+)